MATCSSRCVLAPLCLLTGFVFYDLCACSPEWATSGCAAWTNRRGWPWRRRANRNQRCGWQWRCRESRNRHRASRIQRRASRNLWRRWQRQAIGAAEAGQGRARSSYGRVGGWPRARGRDARGGAEGRGREGNRAVKRIGSRGGAVPVSFCDAPEL